MTFANEIGRVSQSAGVDPHEVMKLLCMDRQLNISSAYLRPGFAFGGSCLPKDLKALLYLAKNNDVELPMLSSLLPSNAAHVDHAVDRVLASGRRSVGMIGLSFKSGTDDLRESPMVVMAERFIGKGLPLCIFDPQVNVARLIGANRRFIEESIPHIASLMTTDLDALVRDSDVLVVAMKTPEVLAALQCSYAARSVVAGYRRAARSRKLSVGLSGRVLVAGHVECRRTDPGHERRRRAGPPPPCADHRREPAAAVRSAGVAGSSHVACQRLSGVDHLPQGQGL